MEWAAKCSFFPMTVLKRGARAYGCFLSQVILYELVMVYGGIAGCGGVGRGLADVSA